jgi:hypothetical protein
MSLGSFLSSFGQGRQIRAQQPRQQFRPRIQRREAEPQRQGVGFGFGAGSWGAGATFDPRTDRRPNLEVIPASGSQTRTTGRSIDLSGLNNPDMGMVEPGQDSGRVGLVAESRGIDPVPVMSARVPDAASIDVQPEETRPPAPVSTPYSGSSAAIIGSAGGEDSAPTAGLRYLLPAQDNQLGDPRRGMFPTGASIVDDPYVSSVSMSGDIDGVAPDHLATTANAIEAAYGPGSRGVVTSGRRTGPTSASDHNSGEAIDFYVIDPDGRTSGAHDPRIYDAARVAVGRGETQAVGIGPDYMSGRSVHFGTGRGQGRDYIRTWSDWNTGAERARRGTGAADPGGAGDPNWNFAGELEGIQEGRQIIPDGAPLRQVAAAPTTSPRPPGRPESATAAADRPALETTASTRGPRMHGSDLVQPPDEFREIALEAATQYNLDPGLFNALVFRESTWRPTAQSPVGAFGLTQAMPNTASSPGYGVAPMRNRDDPVEQLRFGAEYLSAMIDHYGGDTRRALVAYNWGPGNANRWDGSLSSLPRETRDYVQFIEANMGGGSTRTYNSAPAAQPKTERRRSHWVNRFLGRK